MLGVPTPAAQVIDGCAWACRQGWATGTGGGVCVRDRGYTWFASTGVHKDNVQERDLWIEAPNEEIRPYVVGPQNRRPTACRPIFEEILKDRMDGAVLHSHSVWAVLAANVLPGATSHTPKGSTRLILEDLEMLKGIAGNRAERLIPVIPNTPCEADLVDGVTKALNDVGRNDYCILVENHGAYIWGADWNECRRHAEVFHWIFEYLVRRERI